MTEDYHNGFDIVPLDADFDIRSKISSTAASDQHPFRGLYLVRHPPPDHSVKVSKPVFVPTEYRTDDKLIGPFPASKCQCNGRSQYCRENTQPEHVEWHQTVRLRDVEEFRKSTAKKVLRPDVKKNSVAGLCARFDRPWMTSSSIRPVIYRYVDVIKNSFALLEAIHFELFMPDRPDLRFLAVPVATIPTGTVEGDYFHLNEADLLSDPSFAVNLGKVTYPVLWEVEQVRKISSQDELEGLAYIIKKAPSGGMIAISDVVKDDLFIRDNIFPDQESRREHSVVRITFKNMQSTANLFPIEPLPAPPQLTDAKMLQILNSLSHEELQIVYKEHTNQKSSSLDYQELLKWFNHKRGDQLAPLLFKLGHSDVDPRSEYLKRISGVRSSAQRNRRVVTEVRRLSASEACWLDDRVGDFTKYGGGGDLALMDQYFKLGSRYRNRAQAGIEDTDGYTWVNESLVLKTLMEEPRSLEDSRLLMNSIYDRRSFGFGSAPAITTSGHAATVTHKDGTNVQLNSAQSHAVRLYAAEDGPRVFCIRSPPGSGKTTVAVAMAAEIARSTVETITYSIGHVTKRMFKDVQLMLAVQNVAVDNMGSQLKRMDLEEGEVYNMKTKRLNPQDLAPFDFFDLMRKEELEEWKKGNVDVPNYDLKNSKKGRKKFTKRQKSLEEMIIFHRREFEKGVNPKIVLATVEMAIHKRLNDSNLDAVLGRVKRIIVDEASLLTEAALYAIIRRFPEARIVLIGDEKQLPPYQYDSKVLGQELAGRSALSVAMKNEKMPVVNMNEVYRAPPSLITPYNRLAYDNKLESKKAEGEALLTKMLLVDNKPGRPQMVLIDVNGREERDHDTKSLSNSLEIEAVDLLLKNFPREWAEDVMVICLYKDQKLKVDKILNGHQEPKKYKVLTVDAAQGKEAPIVILLTTRTEKATDFFCNANRCNVAVSRQQNALIIMGKASILIDNEPWKTVLDNGEFPKIKYFSR